MTQTVTQTYTDTDTDTDTDSDSDTDGDTQCAGPRVPDRCPRDLSAITGLTATIAGTLADATNLRIVFSEQDSDFNFISISPTGEPTRFDFDDALNPFIQPPSRVQVSQVVAVHFQLINEGTGGDYDFCVTDLHSN